MPLLLFTLSSTTYPLIEVHQLIPIPMIYAIIFESFSEATHSAV